MRQDCKKEGHNLYPVLFLGPMKKPPLNTLTPEERKKRLRALILGGLGKAWMFWPPRMEAKKRARIADRNDVHNGWYVCEICQVHHEKIEIDHIVPCIKPADGFVSWDAYIAARFVESADQLQALCHACHLKKSRLENAARRETKRCAKDATAKGKRLRK